MENSKTKIDLAIIGGGIVGLQVAYKALLRHPTWQVVLFEKERYLGEHSSSRNSGVIHAGLYYAEGSLKHRLCLEGNLWWKEHAPDWNIPYLQCGKYIIARNFDELPSLEALFQKAKLNSVPGLRRAKNDEVLALKEKLHCVAALYSPTTAIIDVAEAINVFKNKVEKMGATILPFNPILNLEKDQEHYLLETVTEKITAKYVVNCAGLGAIQLRKKLGLNELENSLVKGTYLKSSQRNEFKTLIYPLPQKDLGGLGIHLTFDFGDQMKFGPNTEPVSDVSYHTIEQSLISMREAVTSLFKSVDPGRLQLDYCGIRPKIQIEGSTYGDFWIRSPLPHYIECCGIESPGLTASPAIARFLTESWL
ncbi:MAG: NAD(P)/FAD-dependent oxidoreductase [Bacteriovoracaceae bacterium]